VRDEVEREVGEVRETQFERAVVEIQGDVCSTFPPYKEAGF